MRYDTGHKQQTREKLLQEAALAIRRDGPEKLSLSSVMKNAGLTNGGFYAHFKSRDHLLEAGIDQMFREGRARDFLEAEGAAQDNLKAFLRFYLSREHRDARTFGCPLAFLNTDAPRLPRRAAKRYAEGMQGLSAMLARALSAIGIEHAEEEASSLLSELIGAIGRARAEPDGQASDLILAQSRRSIWRRLDLPKT